MKQAIIREVIAMDGQGHERLIMDWVGDNSKKSCFLQLAPGLDQYFGGRENWKLGFVYEYG